MHRHECLVLAAAADVLKCYFFCIRVLIALLLDGCGWILWLSLVWWVTRLQAVLLCSDPHRWTRWTQRPY